MGVQRKTYSAAFKAKVALQAIKGQQTVNEIAAEHSLHPNLVTGWKKHLLDGAAQVFDSTQNQPEIDTDAITAPLYQQIGQLKVELDWVKKKYDAAHRR